VSCTWSGQPQFKLEKYAYQASRVTAVAVRNRDQLAINLLSWHPTEPTKIQLTLKGVELVVAEGKLLSVTGPGMDANSEEGQPAPVGLQENHIRLSKVTTLELPPVSLTTLILTIK
jgi:alpha-L-arabinofuranosidase